MLRWLVSGEIKGTVSPGGHWRVEESALPVAQEAKANPLVPQSDELHVAIIEDDASQAAALARLVGMFAPTASIHLASDGLMAGLVLGAARPHVAFVDIEMPGLDGIEVVRRARKVASLQRTRFVVLSGRLTTERVAALAEIGVYDVFRKPIPPDILRSILDAAMASKTAE
jgi:DNA-binding response OmpR family regulator